MYFEFQNTQTVYSRTRLVIDLKKDIKDEYFETLEQKRSFDNIIESLEKHIFEAIDNFKHLGLKPLKK